jgi:hypothetical protein
MGALRAGLPPEAALALVDELAEESGIGQTWAERKHDPAHAAVRAELAGLLPPAITAEQAAMLGHAAAGELRPEALVAWLRSALPAPEHFAREARRIAAGAVAALAAQPRDGYRLVLREGDFGHCLGGDNRVPGADCPNCAKPLTHAATLDTWDARLEIRAAFRRLPVLFCWRCELVTGEFFYRVNADESVEVLHAVRPRPRLSLLETVGALFGRRPPAPAPDRYADRPSFFPRHPFDLEPLREPEREFALAANRDPAAFPPEYRLRRHQIGGEPYAGGRLADVRAPACWVCRQPMPLLAALCDNPAGAAIDAEFSVSGGFAGDPETLLLVCFCRACAVAGISDLGEIW